MSSIPPKQAPDPSSYEASETGGGLVAMYNAASHASGDSFPVLKAFQDYIEAERSQARKRVMQLSIFFAVLMCVVVTGFLTAGIFMLRNMTTVQSKLLDVALAQREAPAAPPAPAVQAAPAALTSPVLEESVRQMSRATTELQSSLDKKLDGVNEIASKVHEKVASQDSELVKMRDELRKMQAQSTQLKDELVSLKKAGKPAPSAGAPQQAASAAQPPAVPAPAPAVVTSPAVAVAPAALAAGTTHVARPPLATPNPVTAMPEARDPRFPPATKEPPVTPSGVTPPAAPQGMMATAMPLKTKNIGTVPWRVLIPE